MTDHVKVLGYSGQTPHEAHVQMFMPALEMIGELGWDDVQKRVQAGSAQVWVVQEDDVDVAAALTEMVEYAKMSALRVIAIGGEGMVRWQKDFCDAMIRFCKQNKLARIEVVCRPGLERIMRPLGWEKKLVCLIKEVPNGKVGWYN